MDTKRAMGIPNEHQRTVTGSGLPTDLVGGPASRGRGLSRERIVASAIGYVGRNCLADLSMRRLGNELGVEAMSLYRYFPSKAALFDALVDASLGQIVMADGEPPDWESAVRCYATSFRRFARAHPRLFPLLASAGQGNRSVGALMERMLDMWRRAGLDEATARYAQRAVHAFTIGTITAEVGVSFGRPGVQGDPWCAEPATTGTAAARVEISSPADPNVDSAFEFSLDVLIDGLRDRFAMHRVAAPGA